jgi:heme ABC exporter ATP-binding subunit CcmA
LTSALPLAIEAQGVSRRYGRRWALADVDLRVEKGVSFVLTGRNGSGKSTLLRVLATAIRPDLGQVRVAGHDVRRARDGARTVTSLLGHYSNLYDPLTALENLQLSARFLGRAGGRPDLLPTLEQVGLAERADDPVATFSAGMRKRLSIARALLKDAPILLLDEPFGALDPPGFRLVADVLEAARRKGSTVVMATHQLQRGSELGDRALVLQAGRVAWTGPARELQTAGAAAGLAESR